MTGNITRKAERSKNQCKMNIRKLCDKDDVGAVSRVYEQSWKSAYQGIVPQPYLDSISEGSWCRSISAPGKESLILLDHDNIIGTSSYSGARDEKMREYGEIISIYLLPEYCRKGYGSQLLQAAVHGLSDMGYTRLYLWVLEDNLPARRFYEKHGMFADGGSLETTIGGKRLREVRYVLRGF